MPYFKEVLVDFAAAATAKGSALAAADVIEAISVPTNTMILNAGFEIITVAGGESNDNTLDLGTGADADVFVDGFDLDAAAAGAYAQNAAAFQPLVVGGTADTIDLTIATATTAPTSGVVRVFAVLMDIDARKTAAEVDRDTLA
jgi:hypothetical protein